MQTVVLGALVRDDRLLLALRRADKAAYPGVWDLPGGVVEAGESEPDALARELREELGVRIATGSHLVSLVAAPAGEPVTLSAWLVREWVGTPTNTAPEEHDDLAWVALDALPPPVHPPVRAALLSALRDGR
ncbi:NUDIX domain-containing protein [Nocardioides anomalus]|uniref:NUDIX domain-containing protein n=1 Tax=Nocardioides anomalus TaxID=2712223 RepID=A0A6G6W8Y1_9ACTN|nr:NUDIX domain-containing protein [Nocardioides anomalus]QIG41500.1 NUDIX domain-containing protein [Nocardioides anomalus]